MRIIECLKEYPNVEDIYNYVNRKYESAILDSSLHNELGQYSIIAIKPYLKIEKKDVLYINEKKSSKKFEDYLENYLDTYYEDNETGLPLISGAIGYFSYDYGLNKEGLKTRHKKIIDIPECIMVFYDWFIIEDHVNNVLYLIANDKTGSAEKGMQNLKEIVSESHIKYNVKERCPGYVYSDFLKKDYLQAIDNMIKYIIEGDIYVVNMTHQIKVKSEYNPYDMFKRLRNDNPSPFGAYLDYGDFQIVSASPERFMRMKDKLITTRPIKGTRKRGENPEEDMALKEELANSEKDQSELLMIVDLERNDLNKVCVPGSVRVTELFKVETYSTVFHLIANIEGRLKPELNAVSLIKAAFPGGSITGAPKLRAMELIDQEEHSRRNLYTGSIGYISLNGDCDFNIVIRTAVHKDGEFHIGAGGGITCESELDFEYEETWQKARALLNSLGVKEEDEYK